MATVKLSADTFEQAVKADGIVLVDFWASWCGPCRNFAPVFERVSQANPDVVFGKVDTEAEQELAAAWRITSIPMLMAFRDGVLVYAQPGAIPQPSLEELLGKVRGLDMDEVRKTVAAAASAGS